MLHIANAPVSWGVLEFELQGERSTYPQVLDEIKSTGYDGTELGDWGFLPTDPAELRQVLDERGLALVGGFVPVALSRPEAAEGGIEQALRTARLMAAAAEAPVLVLSDDNGKDEVRTQHAGRIQREHGLPEAGWTQVVETAERIARRVREETGLRTALHHHSAGFIETPWEVETFLGLTPPDAIGLCLDTGHYRFGGGDPVTAIESFSDRIWHVHLKDCDPAIAARSRTEGWDYFTAVEHGLFCELGQGDVDLPAVVSGLQEHDYDGWAVVEQDILPGMGTPKESAQRNRAYLDQLGL